MWKVTILIVAQVEGKKGRGKFLFYKFSSCQWWVIQDSRLLGYVQEFDEQMI